MAVVGGEQGEAPAYVKGGKVGARFQFQMEVRTQEKVTIPETGKKVLAFHAHEPRGRRCTIRRSMTWKEGIFGFG